MLTRSDYRVRDDLRRHWLLVIVLAIVVVTWGWLDVRRRGRIEPGREDAHRTDFTVYTVAGSAFFDGRDPYTVTNVRGWSYLYPPLFALAVSPLAELDTETQTFVWFLISAGFAVGVYIESRRLLSALAPSYATLPASQGDAGSITYGWWLLPAFLAIGFPALNCLQRGQIGLLQLYCLLLGARWILTARSPALWVAGGAVLALPAALKITPLLPIATLLLMLVVRAVRQSGERWRTALATAGVTAGFALWLFVVPGLVIGWNSNLRHLQAFSEKVLLHASNVRTDDFGGEIDSPRNQSLDNAIYRLGLWITYVPDIGPDGKPFVHVTRPRIGELPRVPLASQISFAINCLLLLGLCLQAVALGWNGRPLALALGFGLAAALSLIASPVSRGHYFVMLLPALLLAPRWLSEHGRTRAARWAVWLPAVMTILHYALLNTVGRIGWYGLAIAAWYVWLCVTAARKLPAVGQSDVPLPLGSDAPLRRAA